MALTLSNSIFLSGTAFNAVVEGAAADSTLALTTNPGGRWSLGGRLLVCSNPQAGDAPAVTETLAGGGSTAYPFTISARNAPSTLRGSGSPVAASVGMTTPFFPTITGGTPPYNLQVIGRLPAGRSVSGLSVVGTYVTTGPNIYALQIGDAAGATVRLVISENVGPGATIEITGTPLRGYALTASGAIGSGGNWQSRTAPAGTFVDELLANPFTIGNGSGGTGAVGREYRYRGFFGATEIFSAGIGPTGVTDSVVSSAYNSVGQDIANINTDGVGSNVGYIRGVDYYETISYYADEFGAAARMSWDLKPGVGTNGSVFCYSHIRRNRYTDDTAQAAFSAGFAHSELSAQPFAWNLTEEGGSDHNRSYLIEYFSTDSATACAPAVSGVGGNRQDEIGWLPVIDDLARAYFEANPKISLPDYVDENGLTWIVRSKAGPGIIKSGGRYVVAYPPVGVTRLSGNLRRDRYTNWLIAQDVTKGGHFMTGLAAGLEVISETDGGAGAITGQYFPSTTDYPWSGVGAAAYSFDTDVAAYFARFSNLPGIEVRKALDVFVRALKTNSLYALIDDFNPMWLAGKVDMRRAFKSASHDIVDRVGAAAYVPGQGMGYAGAGYGGTGFNPATAGGQFAQDSAFLFGFVEADAGAVSTKFLGNATANMGRNTAGTSISHQLNNASSTIAGVYNALEGFSVRRVAGIAPGGTGGAAGYQVKRSGSLTAVSDQVAASTALTSSELEIGRAGSGSVYSSAIFSMIAYGGGMTAAQVDTFNSLVGSLRTAAKAAGI